MVAAGNTNPMVRKEVIIGFDPVRLRAPFFLRCAAAVIDYLLLIVIPVCGLLLSRFLGNDGTRVLNSEINNFAWILALLDERCTITSRKRSSFTEAPGRRPNTLLCPN